MKRIWIKFKIWCLNTVIKWLIKIKDNKTFDNQKIEKVIDENLSTIIKYLQTIYNVIVDEVNGHKHLGKK